MPNCVENDLRITADEMTMTAIRERILTEEGVLSYALLIPEEHDNPAYRVNAKEAHIERIAIVVVEFQRIVRLVEKKRRATSTPYGATVLTRAVDAMIDHPAWNESFAVETCLVVGQFDDREFGHPRRIDSLHDHSVLILLLGHDSQRSQTQGRHPANQTEKHLQKGGFHR